MRGLETERDVLVGEVRTRIRTALGTSDPAVRARRLFAAVKATEKLLNFDEDREEERNGVR